MSGHVFISYSRKDAAYVARLKVHLAEVGIDAWTDMGIDCGDSWPEVIEQKVRACAVFAPVMSPNARAASWVKKEILLAERTQRPIRPLLLDGEPFFEIGDIQYEDVRGGRLPGEAFVAGLLALTGTVPPPPPPPPPPGLLERVIRAHEGQACDVAFSADGRLLASGGEDEKLAIWDVATGESAATISSALTPCWPLAFLPGSSHLVAAASYAAPGVHIFDARTGAWQRSLAEHKLFGDEISSLVYSPDGKLLATGDPDGALVWRTETGQPLDRFAAGRAAPRWPLAFSPDGSHLVIAHRAEASGPVGVWNLRTHELDHALNRHQGLVTCGAYSPDGSLLATASYDMTARTWDTATGAAQQVFVGHTQAINDAVFTSDGEHLLTGSTDRSIRVWRTKSGDCVRKLTGHRGGVYGLALSPDGELLASAGGDGTVRLWRVAAATAA